MTRTHSNSIVGEKFPQYAYVMAILSGGFAFIVIELGGPFAPWLFYALLAALFSSIWPGRVLYWGGWLCLPIVLLIFFDVIMTWSISGFFRNVAILFKALSSACLGAYVGSKLSVHRIASLFTNRRVKRKRLKRSGNGAQNNLPFKDLATPKEIIAPQTIVKTSISSQSASHPVRALLMGAPVQALNDALIKATQEGDLDRIELLIAGGVDINAKVSDQWASSMIAELGGEARIKTLFGEGAVVALDASGGQGWTALMVATIEGRLEVVRRLLEHGAQASAENNNGWTALRFAVSMDETEIVKVLLDAGADANSKDHEGKTALMQAACENIRESLKILLDAGADPLIKDDSEQTALMLAQKQGHTKVIKLLKEAEAKALTEIDALVSIPIDDDSKLTAKTHRVIKIPRDPYYGLIDRYDVIPVGVALPSGCEETGREGNEEECWDYAWKNSINEPSELGWWLGFSSQINA